MAGDTADDRPDPRHVDDAAQLGALGRALPRAGPRGDRARLAGARATTRRGAPRPVAAARALDSGRDRPLRADHPRARPAADHHRALLRRPVHAAAPDRGLGSAAAALDTAAPKGVLKLPLSTLRAAWPALKNPFVQERPRAAHARAVPLVLHQRAQRAGLEGRLRALLHPGLGASVLPGRATRTSTRAPRRR